MGKWQLSMVGVTFFVIKLLHGSQSAVLFFILRLLIVYFC